ncbi:FAD-linked oxidase C-terminal domain-containing protein [Oceanithermus sp.]|uniref:FAD-binding oxidoreductase n=1 Tax=Oceanithermus sp. TaxID=2268145 RepID=UPI00257DD6BB|nr:FAD-linked oxidase C-terminal domain-containing protein [Oceanithermus sp.]
MPQLGRLVSDLGPDKVLLDRPDRVLYRYDAIAEGEVPLAVVLPQTTEDVARVVRWAREQGVPLFPRGAASGLSGGAVPTEPGVVVVFTRMRRLRIDPARRLAEVEPGVVTHEISAAARPHGLYYPPDPASYKQSTIGGNLAENAGGPQCFKKGVTGDYVLELEWVDADGEVHRSGREAYDVVGALVGSEGTLAMITRAWLRLEPRPRHTRTLMAHFPEVGAAAEAVSRAIADGVVAAKLEFMDAACIRAVEDAFQLGLPTEAAALLLVDTDGDDLEVVEEELERVAEACRAAGGAVHRAADAAEAERLWQARRAVSPALGRIHPHRMNEDIVVPRSRLPEVVRRIRELGEAYGLPLAQFGHIGDGNLHPNILFDPKTTPEERVHELAHAIAKVALEHGGVLSGEHGIGLTKRAFLAEALDAATLAALRRLKRAFDPEGRFNPGKVLP